MNRFDDAPDDIEQRVADDRVPLPTSLRPRILAAVEEALENGPTPLRSSPPWREETVVLATSILLASLAFLVIIPSLVAGPGSGPILGSSESSLEVQARRLGIELPRATPAHWSQETGITAPVSFPHPRSLTPADVRDVLDASF